MMDEFYSEKYNPWREFVNKMRKRKGWTWDTVRFLGTNDESACSKKRQAKVDDPDDYFTNITDTEWYALINYMQHEDENATPCTLGGQVEESRERYQVTSNSRTAWNCYKESLAKKKFSLTNINALERACKGILQHLHDGNQENDKTIHGLVIGNVQSGKTANMEGLMSMAADAGFNLFIILSGTIESLREQTRQRFAEDLNSKNFQWRAIEHPDSRDPDKTTSNLDFSATSITRYYTVCLKNSRRLEKLLYWLNYDRQKKKQMKILLIDDESDQASLNTKKMQVDFQDEQERTAINNIIMKIVNGNAAKDSTEIVHYKAMNYVAYTATPYGNVLNENGEGSLYPSDFITLLSTPDTYFGPKQIFGDFVNGTADPLPVLNEITVPVDENDLEADTAIIESIRKTWDGNSKIPLPDIPQSLKEAVAWFVIATAIQRYHHVKKPVTMLVHHSMETNYHISTANAIRLWYQKITLAAFIALCREVYQKQTEKLSRTLFSSLWPSYGRSCGINPIDDIDDYPRFDELVPHVKNIKVHGIEHITITPDGNEYQYMEGIHLCVDNSTGEAVGNNDDVQVRLLYPKKTDAACDAPAFLVVGGNTLARGLTLEGLVCTYFSRDVRQADTLMQMGRWFGYRRGYELLSRIWMTQTGKQRFEELSSLDIQLRTDIQNRYFDDNLTPAECGPMVAKTVQLTLTARNKMQGAEELDLDFSGQHLQTFKFYDDDLKLRVALNRADAFINGLGDSDEDTSNSCRVWRNISFDDICENLLDTELFIFGHQRTAKDFCEAYKETKTRTSNWNVILQGTKSTDVWNGVGKVTRSQLKDNPGPTGMFNIGILSDPNVWCSDLPKAVFENLTEEEKLILAKSKSKKQTDKSRADFRQLQESLRQRAGISDVPRLVIYCIDHKNKPKISTQNREAISTNVDVIGVEIIMPKHKGAWAKGYQLKQAE